jgi:hypothetical protein
LKDLRVYNYFYIKNKEMERGFLLIKRMQKTDLYIAFSNMIFRYLHLNPPLFIGEKPFFFYPLFSAKLAKISVLLKLLNDALNSSIYLKLQIYNFFLISEYLKTNLKLIFNYFTGQNIIFYTKFVFSKRKFILLHRFQPNSNLRVD